jgi:hypothetical protein
MTKAKASEARAQELLTVVRYVLDNHEWCEYPLVKCAEGHTYSQMCVKPACPGCKMRERAEAQV